MGTRQVIEIFRGPYNHFGDGSLYMAVANKKILGSHFCSHDLYAHGDLSRSDLAEKYNNLFPQGWELSREIKDSQLMEQE